ncbi:MAG: hypothetical protein QOE87_532 [Gaiellales bacterium]|nr:hypothetical protein [Gaiellales bacterium]
MHLSRAGPPQRPGALVDRGSGGVDVVDERHRARPRARCERVAYVAPARERVETALRAHAARAAHERDDRELPPAAELRRQLRGRVGSAQQAPVVHGRHDRERLRRRARQLVDDECPRESRRGDLAPLPARDDVEHGALEPERGARRREPAQPRTGAAGAHGERGRRAAASAQRRGQGAHALAAVVAHPLARAPARGAATRQHEAEERVERGHGARLRASGVTCLSRVVPEAPSVIVRLG